MLSRPIKLCMVPETSPPPAFALNKTKPPPLHRGRVGVSQGKSCIVPENITPSSHLYHKISRACNITSRVLRQDLTRAEPWPVPPCFFFWKTKCIHTQTHAHTRAHTSYLNIVALHTRKLHTPMREVNAYTGTHVCARTQTNTHTCYLSRARALSLSRSFSHASQLSHSHT